MMRRRWKRGYYVHRADGLDVDFVGVGTEFRVERLQVAGGKGALDRVADDLIDVAVRDAAVTALGVRPNIVKVDLPLVVKFVGERDAAADE